jgi:O-antigen/teichoic acid export membrane protein
MNRRLVMSASRAGLAMFVRAAVQSLLLIALARALGSEGFGSWVAVTSLALLVGMVASMGMGYLVLLRSGQGMRRGAMALATGLPWVLWCAVPLLGLFLLLADALLGSQMDWQVLVFIGVAEIVLAAPTLLLALRLQGCGHAGRAQALYIVPPVMRLGYLLLLPVLGGAVGMAGFALWYALSALGVLLLAGWMCRHLSLLPRYWYWRPRLAHARAGLVYLPTRVSAFGAGEVDKILAPWILTSALAGSYSLAARAIGFALLPVHSALAVAQPRLAGLARSNRAGFIALVRTGLAAALIYAVAAATAVAWLAAPVMDWLTGGDYRQLPAAFDALALALVPMVMRHAVGGILLSLGRPLLRVAGELVGMAGLCVLMPSLAFAGLHGMGYAVLLSELAALCLFAAGLVTGLRRWRVDD